MHQKWVLLARVVGEETIYNASVPGDNPQDAADTLRDVAQAELDFELKIELVDPVTGKQRMVLAHEIDAESVRTIDS